METSGKSCTAAPLTIAKRYDLHEASRGQRQPEDGRRASVPDAMVATGARTLTLTIALLLVPAMAWPQEASSPIERYRHLAFPPQEENFDKGWQDRVALEYEAVNAADRQSLRTALKDRDRFVRSLAARVLGILDDKESAGALAELVTSDPEYVVRIRAVEALGFLKMKPEIIELAKKDRQLGVQWSAVMAAGQLASPIDYAAQARQAYAVGIKRDEMGAAKVGKPALDFTAQTSDGKPFKLSSVLGKKPIAIYFAAFDG